MKCTKKRKSRSSAAVSDGTSADTSGEKKTSLSGQTTELLKIGPERPTSAGTATLQKADAIPDTSLVQSFIPYTRPKHPFAGLYKSLDYPLFGSEREETLADPTWDNWLDKCIRELKRREGTASSSVKAKPLIRYVGKDHDKKQPRIHCTCKCHRYNARLREELKLSRRQLRDMQALLWKSHQSIAHNRKQPKLKEREVIIRSYREKNLKIAELQSGTVAKDYDGKHQELKESETAGSSARAEPLTGYVGKYYDEKQLCIHCACEYRYDAGVLEELRRQQRQLSEMQLSEMQLNEMQALLPKWLMRKGKEQTAGAEMKVPVSSQSRFELPTYVDVSECSGISSPLSPSPSCIAEPLGQDGTPPVSQGMTSCAGRTLKHSGSGLSVLSESSPDGSCELPGQTATFPAYTSLPVRQGSAGHDPTEAEKDQQQMFTPCITDDFDDETYRFLFSGPGLFQCRETAESSAKAELVMVSSGEDSSEEQQRLKPRIVKSTRNKAGLELPKKKSLGKALKTAELQSWTVAKDYDEKHQELKERETAGSSARAEPLIEYLCKDRDVKHPRIHHPYLRHRPHPRLQEDLREKSRRQRPQSEMQPLLWKSHQSIAHDGKQPWLKGREETAESSAKAELVMVSSGEDSGEEQQRLKPRIVKSTGNTAGLELPKKKSLGKELKTVELQSWTVVKDYDEKHQELKERETAGSSARAEPLIEYVGKYHDKKHPCSHCACGHHSNAVLHLRQCQRRLSNMQDLLRKQNMLKGKEQTAGAEMKVPVSSQRRFELPTYVDVSECSGISSPLSPSPWCIAEPLGQDGTPPVSQGMTSCAGRTLKHSGSGLSVLSESSPDGSCELPGQTATFPAYTSPPARQGSAGHDPTEAEKDQQQMFTPCITDDFDDETYRFLFSGPGLFHCRVTGLVFHMEGEGEVLYRIVPWDRRLLSQYHKKPAGPLFDITCQHKSMCQLHLPHCEILSTGGGNFLSVAHVNDEGMEFITPHKITESHVIINITGFSGFGNVKDEDSPPDPVRALVLLFYRPPDYRHPNRSYLNVLLVPRNIVIRDVQRTRRKLNGFERYIEAPPHCKLQPKQVYTLSTCRKGDKVKIQPREAEFDGEIHSSYFPSFQVILKTTFEDISLSLTEKSSSSSVWEREVCLLQPTAINQNLTSCQKLLHIWSTFIDGISGPVLHSLLDKLLEGKVITDSEREAAQEIQTRRDKARCVLDTVKRKGEAAGSKMIQFLCEVDPFFSEHLGLK